MDEVIDVTPEPSGLRSLFADGTLPGLEQIIPLDTRLDSLPLGDAERQVVGDIALLLIRHLEDRNHNAMRGGESIIHSLRLSDYAVGVLHEFVKDQRRGLLQVCGPAAFSNASVTHGTVRDIRRAEKSGATECCCAGGGCDNGDYFTSANAIKTTKKKAKPQARQSARLRKAA